MDSSAYAYNPANERTNLTRADSSTVAFSYDKIGQLSVANSSVDTEDRGYFYDAAWNLNRRTNNGAVSLFSVNNLNELTSIYGTNATYDSNGNLSVVGDPNVSGGIVYTYDDENRLTEVYTNFNPGSGPLIAGTTPWRADFVYDGFGRLRKRLDYANEVLQNTTFYIYDGNRVIQERNAANSPTVAYTRGSDLSGNLEGAGGIGGLLARSDHFNGTVWINHNYYHADGNGNITYMVDASQNLAASYRYDPFGNLISSSGSLAPLNLYRFSSGMYYYLYRFYDPNLQRWINRDPLAGWHRVSLRTPMRQTYELSPWERYSGPNLYAYGDNTPVNAVDVNGLWTFGIGGTAGYGLGIAGGVSLGFYVGYDKANGWSLGVLGGPAVGLGGPPNMSAGGFVHFSPNAKCVAQLKGLGGKVGGSAGEGPVLGGDFIFGSGYQGGEGFFGIGAEVPAPVEIHGEATFTFGLDTDKGFKLK